MHRIAVEELKLRDRVKFSPLSTLVDEVVKLHYRESGLFGDIVTVTHRSGCWSKTVGEDVVLVERVFGE